MNHKVINDKKANLSDRCLFYSIRRLKWIRRQVLVNDKPGAKRNEILNSITHCIRRIKFKQLIKFL